jgi:hypothetical protein
MAVVDRDGDLEVAAADGVERAPELPHRPGDPLDRELGRDQAGDERRRGGEPDRRHEVLRPGDVAADRDQRDHQDRHRGAEHPGQQQARADAERARLGRRRGVERQREGGPQQPLRGEVDGGGRRQAGERGDRRDLERELLRDDEVRGREERDRQQPAG